MSIFSSNDYAFFVVKPCYLTSFSKPKCSWSPDFPRWFMLLCTYHMPAQLSANKPSLDLSHKLTTSIYIDLKYVAGFSLIINLECNQNLVPLVNYGFSMRYFWGLRLEMLVESYDKSKAVLNRHISNIISWNTFTKNNSQLLNLIQPINCCNLKLQ